jgi:hypothetical protein
MRFAIIAPIVAMVAFGLCASSVNADLTVSPASVAIHLAGGSITTRQILIDWDGALVTAARLFTNITPNATGLYVSYDLPMWDNYFFLKPTHQNITMTIDTNPALRPGDYVITTTVEIIQGTKIIVNNNTVTVVDPWLQDQYAHLLGNKNSLQENLSLLFARYTQAQKDRDNATANYNRERQNADSLRLLLVIFIFIIIIALFAILAYRRKHPVEDNEMFPDGTMPIDEPPEGMVIVGRRYY